MTDRNGVVAHDKEDKVRSNDLEGLTTRDRLVHWQCLMVSVFFVRDEAEEEVRQDK